MWVSGVGGQGGGGEIEFHAPVYRFPISQVVMTGSVTVPAKGTILSWLLHISVGSHIIVLRCCDKWRVLRNLGGVAHPAVSPSRESCTTAPAAAAELPGRSHGRIHTAVG